jgi:hypothetical protein
MSKSSYLHLYKSQIETSPKLKVNASANNVIFEIDYTMRNTTGNAASSWSKIVEIRDVETYNSQFYQTYNYDLATDRAALQTEITNRVNSYNELGFRIDHEITARPTQIHYFKAVLLMKSLLFKLET